MDSMLLFLHLVSASTFFGSIVSVLAWKVFVDKNGDPIETVFTLRAMLYVDKLISAPSAGFTTASGVALLCFHCESMFETLWLPMSVGIWIISAVAAIGYLIPSLRTLLVIAEGQLERVSLDDKYRSAAAKWNYASFALILMPLAIVWLAVVKPRLW